MQKKGRYRCEVEVEEYHCGALVIDVGLGWVSGIVFVGVVAVEQSVLVLIADPPRLEIVARD